MFGQSVGGSSVGTVLYWYSEMYSAVKSRVDSAAHAIAQQLCERARECYLLGETRENEVQRYLTLLV